MRVSILVNQIFAWTCSGLLIMLMINYAAPLWPAIPMVAVLTGFRLKFPAIVGPMQQGLSLDRPAFDVARTAMLSQLRHMPPHRFPACDLAGVIVATPTLIITAIPLKPAARIIRMNPSLGNPVGQRLGRMDTETIQRRIGPLGRQARARIP